MIENLSKVTLAKMMNVNNQVITFEEHVRNSEVHRNSETTINFNYELSDKAAKAKILKAVTRIPLEIEENSTSTNLVFSAGAWHHAVLPAVRYFCDIKDDNSCKIGDYTVKIGGIKMGKEINGKHVNTKVVFFADRDKIICHLYNTTQLILVNGHGYKKFIDLFLKPFLSTKITEYLEDIEEFNDEVMKKLGSKTVRRSSVKLKKSPIFPCNSCEFAAKSMSTLKNHRRAEHILQISTNSRDFEAQKQSTRNNSIVENLMLENITITDISQEVITVEENAVNTGREVNIVCTTCQHELFEEDDYQEHMRNHEDTVELKELQNLVYSFILETQIDDINTNENVQESAEFFHTWNIDSQEQYSKCNKCEFKTSNLGQLDEHMEAKHGRNLTSSYECSFTENHDSGLKEHIKSHMNKEYSCNVCKFETNILQKLHEHKLGEHTDKINLIAQQNLELVQEVNELKRFITFTFKELFENIDKRFDTINKNEKQRNDETKSALEELAYKITNTNNKKEAPTPPVSKAPSLSEQFTHINNKRTKTKYLQKPKVLYIGDSIAQNVSMKKIEDETNSRIKTAKAYTAVEDLKSRFPNKNFTDVTPDALRNTKDDDKYTELILAAPTVDISNLRTEDLSVTDNVEVFKQKVIISCQNMFSVAQNAILDNPELRKVVIMEHAPRQDPPEIDPTQLRSKLAKLANTTLAQLVHSSGLQDRISVGRHSLDSANNIPSKVYRDDITGKYDGVHMYGSHGKDLFTKSVARIIQSALPSSNQPLYSHVVCPQAQYQKKQQARAEQSVRLNQKYSVPVNNRFSVLGN